MRYLTIVLFFFVLVLPFGVRQFIACPAPIDSNGPMEELSLRIITPHNQDIRREFERAFTAWHRQNYGTGVNIDYLTPGGTNDIIRMLASKYNAQLDLEQGILKGQSVDIELFWGGGDFEFNRCKRLIEVRDKPPLSILKPLPLDDATRSLLREAFPQQALNSVRLLDTYDDEDGSNGVGPHWVGLCLSEFGIVYSPTTYADLKLPPPTKWADFAKPELMGFVALADPTRSGSAGVTYVMMLQRAMADAEERLFQTRPDLSSLPYKERSADPAHRAAVEQGFKDGIAQTLRMAANARYFTDSANVVPKDVSTGDAAIGTAIDFYGRTFEEKLGEERIRYVSPVASTAVTPDPIAILHGTSGKRLELASRFIRFMLTPGAQKLRIIKAGEPGGPVERSLRRPPVRRDVYDDRSTWSDDVNPFESSGGFNQRVEWMEWSGAIRPIWAAAWIDAREPLRNAYRRILAVPDLARREQLLTELCDVPLSLSDVEQDRAWVRKVNSEQPNDAPRLLAERRIDWAKKFRAHYDSVAAKINASPTQNGESRQQAVSE